MGWVSDRVARNKPSRRVLIGAVMQMLVWGLLGIVWGGKWLICPVAVFLKWLVQSVITVWESKKHCMSLQTLKAEWFYI